MMQVIFGGRQTGRTTKLIQMAAEAEAKGEVNYIVCANISQAQQIARRAREMGLTIGYPITFEELLKHATVGTNIKFLLIDNAELLLQYLTRIPIKAITIEDKDATAERFGDNFKRE